MPSSRTPKGVYVRSTPDWFSQNLCIIGNFDGVAVGTNTCTTWSFLNNDQQGRYAYIHAFTSFGDNLEDTIIGWPTSAGGSIVAYGQYARLDQGAAPGVLYRRFDTPVSGDQNTFVPNPLMATTDFYTTMVQLSGAAMWILPVGSFLVFGSNPAGGLNYLTIWYSMFGST